MKRARPLFTLSTFAGVAAAAIIGCGGRPPVVERVAPVSSRCPDLTKSDEVSAFEFAKEYQLSREAADRLKASLLAAIELGQLEEKLDAELGIACAQIAHDLGDKGDWRSGNEACAAANKAAHEARAKLGSKASAQLVVAPPLCTAEPGLVTKCASLCDSSVAAEKVKADCEPKAGHCDGNCEGTCENKAPLKCDGVCTGACDGQLRGTCGGRCRGTCDGRPVAGPCLGTCVGACDKGAAIGECKGTCTGACKLAKPAICDGTCSGKCSVELSDARCAGEFSVPEVSNDCRARCELSVVNRTECGTPRVSLAVSGARDRETSEALKSAVDKSFPALLKILFEVGDRGAKRVAGAGGLVSGARSGFHDMALSGAKGSAPASEAQLHKCFDEVLQKAEASAGAVKLGIELAGSVRDELSK